MFLSHTETDRYRQIKQQPSCVEQSHGTRVELQALQHLLFPPKFAGDHEYQPMRKEED